ncbi:MAG TPA: PD-(D/E)XK nuclease superfamily protein [Polyangiaceae bacterium]
MTGTEYRQLLARYIVAMFGERGIKVYEEVGAGTTIIGKQRRLDLFIWEQSRNLVMAIECKYQDSFGTVDEKIPYALEDIAQVPFPGIIAYAGRGFSDGVMHLLQSSSRAAYCLPDESLLSLPRRLGSSMGSGTWQLDHALAIRFGWWDVLVAGKLPVQYMLGRSPESDPLRQP